MGKIDLRYDYGFNENPTVDAPPTFRPSGCNSRRLHTRHLAVVRKHYTAPLQTTDTSDVVVMGAPRKGQGGHLTPLDFHINFSHIITVAPRVEIQMRCGKGLNLPAPLDIQ